MHINKAFFQWKEDKDMEVQRGCAINNELNLAKDKKARPWVQLGQSAVTNGRRYGKGEIYGVFFSLRFFSFNLLAAGRKDFCLKWVARPVKIAILTADKRTKAGNKIKGFQNQEMRKKMKS